MDWIFEPTLFEGRLIMSHRLPVRESCRSRSSSSRIRSVFSRIALTLLNIHFGGALSGKRSNVFSQSISCIFDAKRLASTTNTIGTVLNTRAFFTPSSCSEENRRANHLFSYETGHARELQGS